MAAQDFDASFAALLVNEGGYTNDPHDPGGATNLGVIQTEYDAYRKTDGWPAQSVRYITVEEAKAIYKQHYWATVRADELPKGTDYCLFDEAVNSGPVQSIKDMQKALGVNADGFIGPITLRAMQIANSIKLINDTCDIRLGWLRRVRTWQWFGKGWTNRIAAVRATALKMAVS